MNKLTSDSKIGEEVQFEWYGHREGTVIEINEDFVVVELKDEYIQAPNIGKTMGFSHIAIQEME